MEVIVENVILDNFTMDYLLLFLTNKFTNSPTSHRCLFVACLFGTGFSLISPILVLPSLLWIILKLVVGLIIVLLSLCSFYKIFSRYLIFMLLTFAFGGAMYAVFYFFGTSTSAGASITYYSEIPFAFVLSSAILLSILVYGQINRFMTTKKYSQYSVDVVLCIRNKPVKMRGFIDTGNTLQNQVGRPVVILNEKDLKNWFNASERIDIILHKYKDVVLSNPQVLSLKTVGNQSQLLVFDADYIKLNERKYDVAVGINQGNIPLSKRFDVLLNSKLIEV